ncbi:MAG: hypothetical protein Q3974_04800 [Rothia sp. (in: high G+C Gram-positive bacteria)]|nr:hypothetical protein [Rothia sp. (in: high G+C Gram-positive bacteria)]
MLNQYFKNPVFITGIGIFGVLGLFSFINWYLGFTLRMPLLWLPFLACAFFVMSLVLFPTGALRLPVFVVPAITLTTLLTVQFMLNHLPHNLTTFHILWLALFTLAVCSGLILRSHVVATWVVFIFVQFLVLKWHLGLFITPTSIFAQFVVPAGILFGVLTFRRQMRQATHRARQSRILLQHAEFGREKEQDVSDVAAQRVQEVRALTEDMLHRIAYNSEPVTHDEIDEFRFTEAQLRDTIRGRHIVNNEILEAAMAARRRGAKVDILDERGEALPPRLVTSLTHCAVDLLDNAHGGTITIRAFPKDDPTAVMLVHDGNSESDEPSAIEIEQDSGKVERF